MTAYVPAELYNYNTASAKPLIGSTLQADWDRNQLMYYSQHGWVESTDFDAKSMYPIQNIRDFNNQRGAYLRTFVQWYIEGEPEIGADAVAREDATVVPQPYYDFKTGVAYSPRLKIIHPHTDRLFSISVMKNYRMQYAQWYASMVSEAITIYFCGMRGQADTNYAFIHKATGSVADIASGKSATMSTALQEMSKINPITTPMRTHTTWRSGFNAGASISPTTATDSDKLTFSHINQLVTYIKTRTKRKEGLGWEIPNTRVTKDDGSRGVRNGINMTVIPEVCYDLRSNISAGDWAELQRAAAGARGFNQGLSDGKMGEIFGALLTEFNNLPRYWGGSGADVPVVRCMIPGAQAIAFGFRNLDFQANEMVFLHPRLRRLSEMGVPVHMYIVPKNDFRSWEWHTQTNMGVTKPRITRPDTGTQVDKGVMTMDVVYTRFEGTDSNSNNIL